MTIAKGYKEGGGVSEENFDLKSNSGFSLVRRHSEFGKFFELLELVGGRGGGEGVQGRGLVNGRQIFARNPSS